MRAVPAGENTILVGTYIADKTGCYLEAGMFSAMAILDDDDNFCGGVAFSEFRGYDCQLSTAAETPIAWRDMVIHAVFDYVFNQLGCQRCTALTRKSNKRARAFLEDLGFQIEGRIRRGYDGVKDAILYGMLREECVYIQEFVDGDSDSEEAERADSEVLEGGIGPEPVHTVGTGQEAVTAPREEIKSTLEFW